MNTLNPSAASPLVRARSLLFLPADRLERLQKALASGAHAVIIDLEDAVAPQDKAAARQALSQAWQGLSADDAARMLVRINAHGTAWHDDDLSLLRELGSHGLGGVMVPKSESVAVLNDVLQCSGDAGLLPLIESAEGLHALDLICRSNGVLRVAFGHIDFQADLNMQCGPEETELDSVRLAFVLSSRRAGLPAPVDGVTVSLDDDSRLAADAARSRRLGFGGKLCIHPKQAAAVNEALGPTAAERAWATALVEASAKETAGAFRLNGQMIDAPVLIRARRILQD